MQNTDFKDKFKIDIDVSYYSNGSFEFPSLNV